MLSRVVRTISVAALSVVMLGVGQVADAGIIAKWRLDDTVVTSLADATGHGYTATGYGSAALGATGSGYDSTGKSIVFSGTYGGAKAAGDYSSADFQNFITLDFRFKPTSSSALGQLFWLQDVANGLPINSSNWVFQGQFNTNGTITAKFISTSGSLKTMTSNIANPVSLNNWHHVVVSYNTTDGGKIMIDGTQQATLAAFGQIKSVGDVVGGADIFYFGNTNVFGSFDEIILADAIPEPASIALLTMGGSMVLFRSRNRSRSN